MIYLDNAATTYPKPPAVIRAMVRGFFHYGANPGRSGYPMAMATAEQVYSCRQALADFFDASCPEEVVFTQNCTHALNLAVKGCLSAGDHVIVSDLEHNSVLRPLHKLAQQGLIEYNVAPTSSDPDETVENYRRLLRGNTRLIVAAHGSNVTGRVQPIRRLGQLARLKGCLFLVDGAQSAGLLPISMKKDFIDFLCLPGHKGLYGPSGTGVLITPHGARMNTLMEGGTGSQSQERAQPSLMPDRLESGTVNTLGILGLGAGLGYVRDKGPGHLYERQLALAARLYEGLSEIKGIRLYSETPAYGRALPVVSFAAEGLPSEEAAARLAEEGIAVRAGLHCSYLAHHTLGTLKEGLVRASFGSYNRPEEVESFLACVRERF